ncbi:hypothetical protein EJB05_49870, partial [Eragrostis curvula]
MNLSNISSSCTSLFDNPLAMQNGSCSGLGCCQANFPPGLSDLAVGMKRQRNTMSAEFPCTYAMAVEKSWYNFSTEDLVGFDDYNKIPGSVPIVLDWAIRNDSCPAEGDRLPMACRSVNSRCVNATTGPGYLCKCKDGFEGNPYIPDGCQDIDECGLQDLYPCHGVCKNRVGGYDCRCKFGTKGDGKNGCTTMFPLLAVAITLEIKSEALAFINRFDEAFHAYIVILSIDHAGVIGVAALVIIGVLFKLLLNGGPILEKVNNIKLFKKEDLKSIIQKHNVYKGVLDGQLVAVKKSINVNKSQENQFANEVIIQSRVIHKNITKLIGCRLEVDVPMLVSEFVPQGSLHDILHGNNKVSLGLDIRLNIAAGPAEGLAYMHSKTSTTILHGDIKPGNILLNDNFDAKISDFGISRLIAIDKTHTKFVVGDMCYMDPVYLQSGLLTKQSDVYSFGVTLLELLTRQKAAFGEKGRLVKAFLDANAEEEGAIELFDKEILVGNETEVLKKLARLIVECLKLDVDERPEMIDVAERLESMKRLHKTESAACGSANT